MLRNLVTVSAGAVLITMLCAQAANTAPLTAWAPKPVRPAPYVAPNKPLKKFVDILARHSGKTDWSETEVLTRDFIGQYISLGAGKKTKTLFYADDRVYWVVMSGRMRVTIDGVEPFIASKGFLVQVPYRVPYSIETVGDAPSLRFEVRPSGETPSYPVSETPDPAKGMKFIQAVYTGRGKYDDVNKPFVDFEKDIVAAGGKGGGVVKDDQTWANIIRTQGVPTPPATDFGHFHEEFRGILDCDGRSGAIPNRGRTADHRRCGRHCVCAGRTLAQGSRVRYGLWHPAGHHAAAAKPALPTSPIMPAATESAGARLWMPARRAALTG